MANMSYCRFQNTQGDLRDCVDALGDELSKDEARAARRMYKLCQDFIANVDEYGINEENEDEDFDFCPRCGDRLPDHPGALSRVDNKTEICSDCGIEEARAEWTQAGGRLKDMFDAP